MLERFAHYYFGFANEKLRGAVFGAADDWDQAVDLAARDEAEHAAGWAGEHGPVRVFLLADFAGIFENEDGSGLHLFGNPFAEKIQFADHPLLLCTACGI